MKNNNPNKKNGIMIGIIVIAVIVTIYMLFFKGNSVDSSIQLSYVNESVISPADIILGRDLLSIRAQLQNTRIDQTFFESESFKNLQDTGVSIEPQDVGGRRNPFAPFGEGFKDTSLNKDKPLADNSESQQN